HLSPGRGQQVIAADHQVDSVLDVVNYHAQLVGPLAERIANDRIAMIEQRVLPDGAVKQVFDFGGFVGKHHSHDVLPFSINRLAATGAPVVSLTEFVRWTKCATSTGAAVQQAPLTQSIECGAITPGIVTLPIR